LKLKQKGELELVIEGETVTVTKDEIEIVEKSPEGLVGETFGGYAVALDVRLSGELLQEGLARELVNKIQNLRKDSGFEVTDRIYLGISGTPAVAEALKRFGSHIQRETLAEKLETVLSGAEAETEVSVNGEKVKIAIIRTVAAKGVAS
jgi:isoleucyl-tRNA synthetase